ncbi:MAG: hypothetical protein M0P14_04565 [Alkaliphilus sp.]|nr:hypothetical protein [Alkaliphilus sp.]
MFYGKLNDLFKTLKPGNYERLQEIKDMVSEEDYQKALELFNKYSDKSEDEILYGLKQLKESVPDHDEIIEKIKPLLNQEQLSKLDEIMNYLNI